MHGPRADPRWPETHSIILLCVLAAIPHGGLHSRGAIAAVDKVGADPSGMLDRQGTLALVMKLNNLIASPGFAAWMEGELLDVKEPSIPREGSRGCRSC